LGEYAHEATVDGIHPTSFGFMMMADKILPVIEQILDH
jgi:lysophospholipase L1-like esterase